MNCGEIWWYTFQLRCLMWHGVMGSRHSLPSNALVGGGNDKVGFDPPERWLKRYMQRGNL